MVELSYIIPLYNKQYETVEFTQRALDSLAEHTQSMRYEIILVDNASPEHNRMTLPELRGRVYRNAKVISLPENVGFGAACNMGFRLAEGHYVVCMNSDAAQVEDTPAVLRRAMAKHGLAVAMPEHWEACNNAGLHKSEEVMGEWYFGAYWMSTRDFIVNVMHGFDSEYYKMCYWEDFDLWSRCFAAGYKVAGYRGTWVKHNGNASSLPSIHELFAENHKKYIERWGTDKVVRFEKKVVVHA